MKESKYIYPSPDDPKWHYWVLQVILGISVLLLIYLINN